jgi:hypothetical protein
MRAFAEELLRQVQPPALVLDLARFAIDDSFLEHLLYSAWPTLVSAGQARRGGGGDNSMTMPRLVVIRRRW